MENIIIKMPFDTDERLTVGDYRRISLELQEENWWIVSCTNEFNSDGENVKVVFCLEVVDEDKMNFFDFEKSDFFFYLNSLIKFKINTLNNWF